MTPFVCEYNNINTEEWPLPQDYLILRVVEGAGYRRRMETEAKAKIVASVWKAKLIQFLAAPCASCFASVDLKEKDEFNLFFQMELGYSPIMPALLAKSGLFTYLLYS